MITKVDNKVSKKAKQQGEGKWVKVDIRWTDQSTTILKHTESDSYRRGRELIIALYWQVYIFTWIFDTMMLMIIIIIPITILVMIKHCVQQWPTQQKDRLYPFHLHGHRWKSPERQNVKSKL